MYLWISRLVFFTLAGFLLQSCQNKNEVTEMSTPPKELESLSWMIGKWQDAEESIDVKATWRWDLDNSYMVQNFIMRDEDGTPFSGWQILGWDPLEKRIRSWIFDSDGGFGEAAWNLSKETWYVNTVYTTADGVKGSATYVYKPVDSNTYLFSTEGGDLGGSFIPDAGPFKFVRKS